VKAIDIRPETSQSSPKTGSPSSAPWPEPNDKRGAFASDEAEVYDRSNEASNVKSPSRRSRNKHHEPGNRRGMARARDGWHWIGATTGRAVSSELAAQPQPCHSEDSGTKNLAANTTALRLADRREARREPVAPRAVLPDPSRGVRMTRRCLWVAPRRAGVLRTSYNAASTLASAGLGNIFRTCPSRLD